MRDEALSKGDPHKLSEKDVCLWFRLNTDDALLILSCPCPTSDPSDDGRVFDIHNSFVLEYAS